MRKYWIYEIRIECQKKTKVIKNKIEDEKTKQKDLIIKFKKYWRKQIKEQERWKMTEKSIRRLAKQIWYPNKISSRK